MSNLRLQLQKGLVGHWTMDSSDTSNGELNDRGPYNRSVTLSGNETQNQPGRIGESYRFPGTSPQQAIIDLSDLTWTGSHTLSVWVYYDPNSSGSSNSLGNVALGDTGFNGPCLFADLNNNRQRFWDENPDGNLNIAKSINKGEWIHVVGRKDGNTCSLWIDGVKEASATLPSSKPSNPTSRFVIGGNDSQSSLEGHVDDGRLYDRALSDAEINALYQMRSNRYSNV